MNYQVGIALQALSVNDRLESDMWFAEFNANGVDYTETETVSHFLWAIWGGKKNLTRMWLQCRLLQVATSWLLESPLSISSPKMWSQPDAYRSKGLMTSSWMSFPCINCNRSNLGYTVPNHEVQKISPKSSSLEITQFGWRHFWLNIHKYTKNVCLCARVWLPCLYRIYLFLRAILSKTFTRTQYRSFPTEPCFWEEVYLFWPNHCKRSACKEIDS